MRLWREFIADFRTLNRLANGGGGKSLIINELCAFVRVFMQQSYKENLSCANFFVRGFNC